MKKGIGWLFFKIAGWKVDISVPVKEIPKCVLVAAPHTSNWDFFYTVMGFWLQDIPLKFFIKDSYTRPWYGFIMRWAGGIGVDRSKRSRLVEYGAEVLKERQHLYLLNSPEGSRSRAEKWKTGFYYIAKGAGVPILLGYCDYEKKKAGIGRVINLDGKNQEEVFEEMQDFYKEIKGKHPEKFNPKIY